MVSGQKPQNWRSAPLFVPMLFMQKPTVLLPMLLLPTLYYRPKRWIGWLQCMRTDDFRNTALIYKMIWPK